MNRLPVGQRFHQLAAMHLRVLLLVIGLCSLSQAATYHFIGTGRGALTAVQTGPTAYKIEEQPWSNDDIDPPSDAQLWSLEYNRKIANQTLFIRSKLYPTQVWDATGNTVQPGTKVILYANKSTEVASRNQRWNFTYPLDSLKASGIYSAMDYASFVTVNSVTGTLEMQRKISTPLSPYQSFYPIQQGQNPSTFVTNSLWTEVYVRAKGPLGEFYVWSIWPQTPMNYGLPKGVILEFATDENFQDLIAPSPYVITGSANFRVPMPPRLPEGPRKYTGLASDPNFPNTLVTEGTFTFKNDLVAGSGKATVQGTSYVFTWTVTSGEYRAGDSDFQYEVRYSNGVTAHMTAYVSSDATEFGGYINYNEPDSFRFYLSPV